ECVNADIEGSFNGELLVSDLLSLKSSAVIEGTVEVSKLAVEPGATFNATCSMKGKSGSLNRNTSDSGSSSSNNDYKSTLRNTSSSKSNEPAKAS
ncbi:MAG TPA: polymer-forming cytoskeletal protein, partial [Pricia sp.]|nr:polymer-forming cytoskeletal protein [Pricia sp.]